MLLEEHLANAKSDCKPEDLEIYSKSDLELAQQEHSRASVDLRKAIIREIEEQNKLSDQASKISKKIHNASIFTNLEKLGRQMENIESERNRIQREYDRKNEILTEKLNKLEERIGIVKESLVKRGLI
ncbi:hypothetical protein [Endozoicomonas sp. 8E]|uniref:hypothetical protein n=1 Tax=Endozoicomonas sp. 8E TaxID=3035692 RepID=UPI002938D7A2|nr:hypothetical protein [Endozoicomonas sp. 8E]WOG29913.1 hypothetical protein P6910_09725 [Endozoicomonas sp. 8E]